MKRVTKKIRNIEYTCEQFKPQATVLFASHSYFCREENFYLNKFQNTPNKIRRMINDDVGSRVVFMKPGQRCKAKSTKRVKKRVDTGE